jgi:hypothetical protein
MAHRVSVSAVDHHTRTQLGEQRRDGLPDTAATADHDSTLTC